MDRSNPHSRANALRPSAATRLLAILLSLGPVAHGAASGADAITSGHKAFSEGRYDDAVASYRSAMGQGSTWDWLPGLIVTAENRKKLGSILPQYTHRLCMVFVASIDDGSGRKPDASDAQKESWKLNARLLKEVIESLSQGKWSMSVAWVDARSTLAKGDTLQANNPDRLDLGGFFFQNVDSFDTLVTVSNTVSPALGLARTYPFINGVLYGPPRGMALMNAGSHGFEVLFHEFFHVIEWVSGGIGGPAHGFQDTLRNQFPGWKGKGELDYYRWHFENTLPVIGWRKLNHTERWRRLAAVSDDDYARIASAYAHIPMQDRIAARSLVLDGDTIAKENQSSALAMYQRALDLSPYEPLALDRLARYFRDREKNDQRAKPYLERLALVRSVTDYGPITPETESYGTAIGTWHPEQISESARTVEWLLPAVPSGHDYSVTFSYVEGWNALEIQWAALYADGVEISRDTHVGSSGTKLTDVTYRLKVPVEVSGARLSLVALVKGKGGYDSNGVVFGVSP